MGQKVIFRRRRANDDIETAIAYYLGEAGSKVASDFINQLEKALNNISRQPTAGSPRYGHELRIRGLRQWPMRRFPYLIFYLVKDGRIEVLRILHSTIDIPSWLDDDE